MRYRLCLTALMAMLLGAAPPQLRDPTPDQLSAYANTSTTRIYPDEPIAGWEDALRKALDQDADLTTTAAALASAYRLPPAQMRELIALWVTGRMREDTLRSDPALGAELRRRLLALVRMSGHAPLAVRAAAESLDRLDHCSAADFAALVLGAPDRAAAAWQAMSGQVCAEAMLSYLRTAPDRPAPALARLASFGVLGPIDSLPAYAWLLSDAGLAHVVPASRFTYEAAIRQHQLRTLFDAGLAERGFAEFEALPAPMREAVIAAGREGFTATVDGLPVAFGESDYGADLAIDLAAAYALAGRAREAEAMMAKAAAFAPRWRKDELAVLDQFVHRPRDDSFALLEKLASGGGSGGPMREVRCRLFAEYEPHCAARRSPQPYPDWYDAARRAESARIGKAIAAVGLPGYADYRAEFPTGGTAPPPLAATSEPAAPFFTQPPPPAFAVTALPKGFGKSRPIYNGWPKDMTPLPEDFFPIRTERSGTRVAAVSISNRYRLTNGQRPSRGDYWVHLSGDGGQSWRSYFTGLISAYPYVILSSSNLPMLGRDTLDLEVEALADDPVPGRTYPLTRRTPDLAIHIPVAAITADADGDGLTDIAARWLLLDRPRSTHGSPFVLGTSPASQCSGPLDDERQLLAMIIDAMQWGTDMGWTNPLLLAGDPAAVACIPARRKVVVYHPADIARPPSNGAYLNLQPLPRLIFNRARDRAFGGEWHAKRVGGVWHIERDPPPLV